MATEENKADATMAAEGEGRNVGLLSAEGDRFEVPLNVAIMSELVKTMIDGTLSLFFGEIRVPRVAQL